MYLHYPADFPPTSLADITKREEANLIESLGETALSDPRNIHSMTVVSQLGRHDLSAMRELLGMPKRCLCATRSDEGRRESWWWTAYFDYGKLKAYYEVGAS